MNKELVYRSVILVASSWLQLLQLASCTDDSYNYEKLYNFKLSRRANHVRRQNDIPLFDRDSYPQPLPVKKQLGMITKTAEKIQQGMRQKNDMRVYSTKFDYEAQAMGHQIVYREVLDCIISYLLIETDAGVPIVLRGGVGYRFFVALAKARPGDKLSGRVRAYCLKPDPNAG